MTLRLADGTVIRDLVRPPQGMRHRVLLGVDEASGQEVVAKIELIPGALDSERRALGWIATNGGPAPRVLATGAVLEPAEHTGAACLVTERIAAAPPTSPAGWERLGRALARLTKVPWEGSGLPTIDHAALLRLHERRAADLDEALGGDLAASLPAVPPAYADSPPTLTHGDPGPGNFLDDGLAGTIIDWEDAAVAPRGLDLGRARFIAHLGSGPEGYVGEDEDARAAAVTAGYLEEAIDQPGEDELAWWFAVAGVQFAHRRLQHAGRPGALPWLAAVATLEAAVGKVD